MTNAVYIFSCVYILLSANAPLTSSVRGAVIKL